MLRGGLAMHPHGSLAHSWAFDAVAARHWQEPSHVCGQNELGSVRMVSQGLCWDNQ